jgi:purine-binding chemotaxis protein CheW
MKDNYIVFSLNGTPYALPSREVTHVELLEYVTRVPNAPHYVDGVVFSRGAVVPALNLRARFGFERVPVDAKTRLVVVQQQGRHIGLVVDSAREFLTIPETAIQPPSEALTGLSGRYIRGIATLGERLIIILNLSEVLNVDELPIGGSESRSLQETR